MAVLNSAEDGFDENYSPQLPEPSEPSPISTAPMNICKIEGWETCHTTTGYNTFYCNDEAMMIYFEKKENKTKV